MTTPIHFESLDDGAVMDFKIITPSVLLPVDKRWPDVEATTTLDR